VTLQKGDYMENPKDLNFNSEFEFAEDFLVTLTNEFNKLRKEVTALKKENEELSHQLFLLKNKVDPFGF